MVRVAQVSPLSNSTRISRCQALSIWSWMTRIFLTGPGTFTTKQKALLVQGLLREEEKKEEIENKLFYNAFSLR